MFKTTNYVVILNLCPQPSNFKKTSKPMMLKRMKLKKLLTLTLMKSSSYFWNLLKRL